jgi:iron uptake system component EfeO
MDARVSKAVGTGTRRALIAVVGLVVALALIAGVLAIAGIHRVSPAAASDGLIHVEVGLNSCGVGWTHPTGGEQRFEFSNTADSGTEVYVQNTATNAVYLDLEGLGIGAKQRATVVLGDGTYRMICIAGENSPITSTPVTIAHAGAVANPTPGVVPVTANDLLPAVAAYKGWITSQLPILEKKVVALDHDVRSGHLRRARKDWLSAHLSYETLGAAYGAFGDADTAINGLPASGSTALTDKDLQGFHKIEALLYTSARSSTIAPFTAQLITDVKSLAHDFPSDLIEPNDVGLRSHEILENAIQFELNGTTDAGSHTTLATIDANLTGTLAALKPISGLLASRYPKLAETRASIAASQKLLKSYDHSGSWTPLQKLSFAQRQQLNARLDAAVELLAPVAAITTARTSW